MLILRGDYLTFPSGNFEAIIEKNFQSQKSVAVHSVSRSCDKARNSLFLGLARAPLFQSRAKRKKQKILRFLGFLFFYVVKFIKF